jgi:hypothetical protein
LCERWNSWKLLFVGLHSEKQLLADGYDALAALLNEGPGLELRRRPAPHEARDDAGYDAFWEVAGDASSYIGTFLVEAKGRVTPRTVEHLRPMLRPARLHLMHEPTVLILAPWISPRSRALIAEEGWSYLDLTGNALIRMRRPALYVRLVGSDTDPNPRERSEVLLRGTQIHALVRVLADVEPPYRLADLTEVTGLSKGYVSKALSSLHEQGLIDRPGSGPVTGVDWPQLLRARAAEYQVLRTNRSITYQARRGLDVLLRELPAAPEVLVTGSYAAHRIAPVAAPAQLVLYVPDIDTYAKRWELLTTSTGANVVLLEAASGSQLERPRDVGGLRHVGYSQLVMDLLSGNGRLPEEGEAVLQWMIDTPGWRLPDLKALHQ